MKTTKVILGIISIVLFMFIMFQSCAVSIATASDKGDGSAGAGVFLSFSILIAGIIALATQKSRAGGIVAGAFYLFAALMGFSNAGRFKDLEIWSWMCLIFGVVFVLGSILTKKKKAESDPTT